MRPRPGLALLFRKAPPPPPPPPPHFGSLPASFDATAIARLCKAVAETDNLHWILETIAGASPMVEASPTSCKSLASRPGPGVGSWKI